MKQLWIFLLLTLSLTATAKDNELNFSGPDFSGVYSCKGTNSKEGDYEIMATLKLNRAVSHDNFGIYDFSTETENDNVYKGQAIANGYKLALTFNVPDGRKIENSTGIADVIRLPGKRWAYTNNYYEPDENGGNYGKENCLMQKAVLASKKLKKKPIRNAEIAYSQQVG
jgi:hypothetical protein